MKKTPKLGQLLSLSKRFYECGTQKRLILWGHKSWLIYFDVYAWFPAVRTPWHLGAWAGFSLVRSVNYLSTSHLLIFIRPLVTKYLWDLNNFVKFVFKSPIASTNWINVAEEATVSLPIAWKLPVFPRRYKTCILDPSQLAKIWAQLSLP